ncbi:hypothetical protein [Mycolicibacterium arenosum]|uniref:Uncharacterized protein n=1 Tax=Mycolicibacterium arenosum TaxID=2952157 RepID=A0ABT1M1E2_9MYCO|nr:hypothetical protein [Mycolicibacterium sp. CAU 1645]MCP9272964.1 hypothetical protein [Mycolicibacterium sp. CAU 1645]
MTTTNSPSPVHRTDAPNTHGAPANAQPNRVVTAPRGRETKASFKTTEFIVFIVATIGVLIASYLVQDTDSRGDYFVADKAWLYVVILAVGYMVSRGIAKAGSRHHDDA